VTACDEKSCIDCLETSPLPDVLVVSRELPTSAGAGFPGEWLYSQGDSIPAIIVLTADMEPACPWKEHGWQRIEWIRRPFRLTELLASIQSIERVPRNRWRCCQPEHLQATSVAGGSDSTSFECTSPDLCCEIHT
jgi:DNA-binding response OmpR family regulator